MKRTIVAALIGLSVSTMTLAGCSLFQSTGQQTEYQQAQEVYIAIVTGLILAYDAGEITPEQWDQTYLPLINRGDSILDRIERGGTFSDALRAELNEIMLSLARERGQ